MNKLKEKVEEVIASVDVSIGMHDFRITKGPLRINVIFDIEVPFGFKYTDEEITNIIEGKIKEMNSKFHPVIHVDKKVI